MAAPSFTLQLWGSDEIVSLDDYHGKALLITFWVSWCPDCQRDLHNKQQLYQAMNTQDVDMLMIHVPAREKEQEAGPAYIDKKEYTFPTASDHGSHLYDRFQCMSVPTTFLINEHGDIAGRLNDKASFQELLQLVGKVFQT